jgi:hypothetical protein
MLDKVRKLSLGFALVLGSLLGIPMRPEQIRELLRSANQPQVVQTISDDKE